MHRRAAQVRARPGGKMAEAAESVAKDAKGFADDFVGILGLVDIIYGGLTLYWAQLVFPRVPDQLPSTGHTFIDVALLACAAAVAGKLVSLLVDVMMVIVWNVVARPDDAQYERLCVALAEYRDFVEGGTTHKAALESPIPWRRVLVDAVVLGTGATPAERGRLERAHARVEFTYGVAILVALFATHFASAQRWWVGGLSAIPVLVLIYRGTVEQRAYLDSIRATVVRAHAATALMRSSEISGGTSGGTQSLSKLE
jgi:hypothetical protein